MRALSQALWEDTGTVRLSNLQDTALSVKAISRLLDECLAGEAIFKETEEEHKLIRARMKLDRDKGGNRRPHLSLLSLPPSPLQSDSGGHLSDFQSAIPSALRSKMKTSDARVQFWTPEPVPAIPVRNRLYSPEPIGIGTAKWKALQASCVAWQSHTAYLPDQCSCEWAVPLRDH